MPNETPPPLPPPQPPEQPQARPRTTSFRAPRDRTAQGVLIAVLIVGALVIAIPLLLMAACFGMFKF